MRSHKFGFSGNGGLGLSSKGRPKGNRERGRPAKHILPTAFLCGLCDSARNNSFRSGRGQGNVFSRSARICVLLRAKVLIHAGKIKVNQAGSRLIKVNQGLLKHFFMLSVRNGPPSPCPASIFLAESVLIGQSVARNQLKSSHFSARIGLFANFVPAEV
jgi:hypothetical protein